MNHRIRPTLAALVLAAVALLAAGCGPLFGSDEGKPTVEATPIESFVGAVGSGLRARSLTSQESQSIEAGALAGAKAKTGVAETDLEQLVPAAMEGAMDALGKAAGMTEDRKAQCAEAIGASFVAALKGRFAATGMASARALDGGVVASILERLSKAAVANLSRTGIAATRRAAVAGAVVGTIVGSLDEGGVDRTLVNAAVGRIAAAAVQAIAADTGISGAAAKQAAVEAIAKGAVSGIAQAAIPGVEAADKPALVREIAAGAASAVGSVAASSEEIAALAKVVAAGAAEGVVELKKDDTSNTLDDTTVKSMIANVAAGSTSGIMKAENVDPAMSAANLIGSITAGASKALAAGASDLGTALSAAVAQEIAKGASAAAQTAVTNGLDAAALAAAIKIADKDGATVVVDLGASIADGIALGNNASPLVDAAPYDRTVVVGGAHAIDASKSSDAEDTAASLALSFAWSLVKPAGSSAALSATAGPSVTLTPDIVGSYLVTLRVADSKGAVSTADISIIAKNPASDPLYGGKTASQRLAAAIELQKAMDMPGARDELLLILAQYPQAEIFAEVYYQLGLAYRNLGYSAKAKAQFDRAVALYPAAPAAYAARIERAWRKLSGAAAAEDLTAVKNDRAGTADAARAILGLGLIKMGAKDLTGAKTLLEEADAHAQADLFTRYTARLNVASCIMEESGVAAAEAEAGRLLSEARYYCDNPQDASTFKSGAFYDAQSQIGNAYVDLYYLSKDAADLMKAVARFEAIRDDQRVTNRYRLLAAKRIAELYLWDFPRNEANLKTGLKALVDAFAAYPLGTTVPERNSYNQTLLRKAQTHEALVWELKPEADRKAAYDAAVAAYDQAAAALQGAWYGVSTRGNALANKAGISLWYKRDYAAAAAAAQAVVAEHPAEYDDQKPLATALLRLGQVYSEQGWAAKDSNGTDHVPFFERALALYSRVAPSAFPGLPPKDWYFLEAAREAARAYSGLGQVAIATSRYATLLADPSYAPADRAWMQKEYAEILAEEAMTLLRGDPASQAGTAFQDAYAAARAAFLKVPTFTEGDGSLPDTGRPAGEGYAQAAWYALETGRILDEERGKYDLAKPYYEDAVAAASALSDPAFAGYGEGEWGRFAADRRRAQALTYLGRYDESRALLDSIFARVQGGIFEEFRGPRIMKDKAWSLRKQADRLKKAGYVTSQAAYDEVKNLYLSSIAASKAVRDVMPGDGRGAVLDPSTCGWALSDAGWAYNNLADLRAWRGYSGKPDYATVKSELAAIRDGAQELKGLVAAILVDGKPVDDGGPAAAVLNSATWVLLTYAYYLDENLDASEKDAKIAAFQACAAQGDRHGDYPLGGYWDIIDLLHMSSEARFEQAKLSQSMPLFIEAEDRALMLIADPDADVRQIARACLLLGKNYIMAGPSLVAAGTHPSIKTENDWLTAARLFLNRVTVDYKDSAESWVVDEAKYWIAEADRISAPAARGLSSRTLLPATAPKTRALAIPRSHLR